MQRLLDTLNGRRRLLQEVLAVGISGRAALAAGAPADGAESVTVRLGSDRVRLSVQRFGHGGLRYLNLHENEQTSVQAAKAVLARSPGTLIELHGQGRRLLSFREGPQRLAFDPNRIFTEAGSEMTLRHWGSFNRAGLSAARQLRQAVLSLLEGRPDEPLIALHNNAGSNFSVDVYRPGGVRAADVQALHVQPGQPPDAFFLVTRVPLYVALREARFNVVLQNDHPVDDGSLSVWAQREKRAYVNVEARFGALREQQAMLEAVTALAQR